jgi:hypothetical protein
MVYLVMLSVTQTVYYQVTGWLMNNELKSFWKEDAEA